ncbi:polyribonucleotide nucleotidyltransferase [Lentisphaerota bacterium ZTH]|nr:polyribonucleotide nucleotidyltransferase [Lentisphaerota bacterium]WET05595.1 polyribonucleotide nucleotidyltransferase [Lentisphaerota bacterium ZTH]
MAEEKVLFNISEEKSMEISTGKLAKLANGSCLVRMGDTVLLVAACSGPARPGSDFFPLQVDYREKYSAAGKFPGGYIKREGRPSEKEILTCRVTDRPLRPLFPKGFFDEVQIQALLLSADGQNESDVMCILGASAALTLSDLPFMGPIGALRVGKIDGKLVANPTHDEMKKSSLELIYAGSPDKVIMIEGEADELTEAELEEAMRFANEIVKVQVQAQLDLAAKAGKEKKEPVLHLVPEAIEQALDKYCEGKIEDACLVPGKNDRLTVLDEIFDGAMEELRAQFTDMDADEFKLEMKKGFDALVKKTTRNAILEKQYRPDGRGIEDIRELTSEVNLLPIVHGSGLFTRGETQALVIATLGNEKASQEYDIITGPESGNKRFYLHYNFPNFSVGEVGRIMGPGRREIGHGNLAERSVAKVIPEDFPYVVRCVSEVMSSNGSTSMASVCGATLALMDAGVPIKAPVGGISCGLVTGNGKELLLTDIIGAEDHFGDMDFKVCGTREGITGFQLDLKLPGISIDLLCEGMKRNYDARMKVIDCIESCLAQPREKISPNAPGMAVIKINPDKIGALIGPGGKNIRSITEETSADIDVEEDGTVKIMAENQEKLEEAKNRVIGCTAEPEIGKIYRGKVVNVRDFGAFVEIMPGCDGLLHISEMANYRVRQVKDICNEGDFVTVKVIDIDQSGKIRLSRKAALEEIGEE